MKKHLSCSLFFILIFSGISNAMDSNATMLEREEAKVTPTYLYKIVSPEEWQKSKGEKFLETSSFDEKFIHLATKEQLPHVAQKFWNEKEYVILTLDTKKLLGRLVYETNPGGTTLYYHLYDGKIPLDAVKDVSFINTKKEESQ